MTVSTTPLVDPAPAAIADAWQRQTVLRRIYSGIGVLLILGGLAGAVWFADENNAGHFFDRLPHLFDFLSWLIPKDWNVVTSVRTPPKVSLVTP